MVLVKRYGSRVKYLVKSISLDLAGEDSTRPGRWNGVALKRQRGTTYAAFDSVAGEMAKAGASPPKCSQSRLTSWIEALCQQYNALVAADNRIIGEHNGAVSRQKAVTPR